MLQLIIALPSYSMKSPAPASWNQYKVKLNSVYFPRCYYKIRSLVPLPKFVCDYLDTFLGLLCKGTWNDGEISRTRT